MRTYVEIEGPDYALVGDNVTYNISSLVLPSDGNTTPIIKEIVWTKNGNEVVKYPSEDDMSLNLWDVDYPAEGEYGVSVTVEIDGGISRGISNTIDLKIGTAPKNINLDIISRDLVRLKLGEDLVLSPTVIADPITSELGFSWDHNGNNIGTSNSLYINSTKDTDFGTYTFTATATNEGAYIPVSDSYTIEVVERIDPPTTEDCCQWQTRPLKYRDTGFTWMGFWVINEIIQANRDGFDWEANYTDPRFKYSCQIGIIVNMMNQYDEVCVMNSKNGRRWNKNDLKTRTEDIYYQFT